MALQHEKVVEVANACASLAERTQELVADIQKFITQNSNLAIEWTGDPLPSYISEEANGNLLGLTFDRSEVSNAVFSLSQVVNAMTNQAISQGDHLGNLNKLASA